MTTRMVYDEKIAIVLLDELPNWQKLNVAAFLASAIAIKFPETHGANFVNASGSVYLPFIKHPMLIYRANTRDELQRTFKRAKERDLSIGIYTEPLFSTKSEAENLDEISKCTDDDHLLVGIVLYGENKKVNKSLDGLKFHP